MYCISLSVLFQDQLKRLGLSNTYIFMTHIILPLALPYLGKIDIGSTYYTTLGAGSCSCSTTFKTFFHHKIKYLLEVDILVRVFPSWMDVLGCEVRLLRLGATLLYFN